MLVSLPASPWFYRLLNGLLVLVVAWLAATLLWLILAPNSPTAKAMPPLQQTTQAQLDVSPLLTLFGGGGNGMQPSNLDFKVRGLIASSSPAAAIFERSGQPAVAVKTGEELESGVRLLEVNADHVVVDNRGRRERLELDTQPGAPGIVPASEAPPAQLADEQIRPVAGEPRLQDIDPAPPPPPRAQAVHGSKDKVINRTALAQGMQSLNITQWAQGMSDATAGGIQIDNASAQPLAPLLGLQNGDILKSVNGAQLGRTGDISNLYGAFSRAPNVTLELVRNGRNQTLQYRIEK